MTNTQKENLNKAYLELSQIYNDRENNWEQLLKSIETVLPLLYSIMSEEDSEKANEFDTPDERTENYTKGRKIISDLGSANLIKTYDYINLLLQFVLTDNKALDDAEEILKPLEKIIDKLRVDGFCPHCKGSLYMSDLPQYGAVCPNCDENFN